MTLALIIIICIETLLLAALMFKLFAAKYDGSMVLTETDEKKTFSLEFDVDPEDLEDKKRVILRMQKAS